MGLPEDILRFEHLLNELIIRYEQYFVGIEKREPLGLLAEVEQFARRYTNTNITNTALRFKYNSLLSSLTSHRQKWTRVNRLIEEGKYQRDRFKMALRAKPATAAESPAHREPQTAPPTQPQHGELLDKLYQDYLEARRRCNLPTDNVTRDKMAAAIQLQTKALTSKYRCADVDLRVVIEEGKPRIKARPRTT